MCVPDALSWGAYGLVIGDGALMGYGLTLSTCTAIVLFRLWWTTGLVIIPGRAPFGRASALDGEPTAAVVALERQRDQLVDEAVVGEP